MKNIIVRKTLDYGNKGELLVQKNGKITVEVVDPKSLRQIIDYAKNNFYNLEGAVLDEDNFSFNYGEYKVTFEFYRSYDFIKDNLRSLKSNKKVSKISFENSYDLVLHFEDFKLGIKEYEAIREISDILSKVKSKEKNINYHIKGDNLYVNVDGVIIELNNYEKFASNKYFKYIFEDIRKKKIKVIQNTILVGTLSLVSAISVTSLITDVKAANDNKSALSDTKIETSIPLVTTEETLILENNYVDSEPESLTNISEIEITTEVDTKQETLTEINSEYESDKYEDLGIGSLANDEKLLTTKRLYFDIIEKYASKYGLDPYLMLAIATQERGVHSSEIDEGGAIGLMQIQVDVWDGETLTVFDYENNKEVTINFTLDKMRDLEWNIIYGCAVMQHNKNLMDGNMFTATQSYNSGPYAVMDMVGKYKASSGKTTEEINIENDLGWYDYCTSAYRGDPNYLENILRYYQGDIRNLESKPDRILN